MTTTLPMLQAYPAEMNISRETMAKTIDALVDCAEVCTACADACLSEADVASLAKCIRTDLDCADICSATARVLSRHTGYDANLSRALLSACVVACRTCADECGRHADMHEHCRLCAEACQMCQRACEELLEAIGR